MDSKIEITSSIDFNRYPIEIWCNSASHLNRRDFSALMTTCSFFNKHPSLKERVLLSEYNSFKELKVPNDIEQMSSLINLANTYENYCKIINLDEIYLNSNNHILNVIENFSRLLGRNGSIHSLLIMYSNDNVTTKLKAIYESYPFEMNGYPRWLEETIVDIKCVAASWGNAEIIKNFFPDIVNSKILAVIFTLIETAYLLGEYLLKKPSNPLQDNDLANEQKLFSDYLTNNLDRNISQSLLALQNNLHGYRSAIEFLILKGVLPNQPTGGSEGRDGRISYLKDRDDSISITHFCKLYRDFVPPSIKELFDIVCISDNALTKNHVFAAMIP